MNNAGAGTEPSIYRRGWAENKLVVCSMLVLFCVDFAWMAWAGWTIPPDDIVTSLLAALLMLLPMAFGRYRSSPKISALCLCAAFLVLFTQCGAVFTYLVASTNAPLVDHTLNRWDRALGFDWPAVYTWVQAHPWIRSVLAYAYASARLQIALVLIYLCLTDRRKQLTEFTTSLMICFALTVLVSYFFPAGEASEFYANVVQTDVSLHTHFALVRDGSFRALDLALMQGMVAMPSFHTVMAILLAYAMRNTRLYGVFIVLNLVMILSTPTEGGHYMVDILGGILTAAVGIWLARARVFLAEPESGPVTTPEPRYSPSARDPG
jgi:membrane-associated phospholipid phosphatase